MPREKELEQLPMANTLPGLGKDRSKFRRESLKGRPKIKKKEEKI